MRVETTEETRRHMTETTIRLTPEPGDTTKTVAVWLADHLRVVPNLTYVEVIGLGYLRVEPESHSWLSTTIWPDSGSYRGEHVRDRGVGISPSMTVPEIVRRYRIVLNREHLCRLHLAD
ncbi:hypothetical protein [Bifidobacterium felsineum]|uniref:hypothetical protein n=1 Tax=Bifidobacterium felsineum TaxID=2045440 RepID=UPI001BDD232B|nr:hypothetical protein [Bifidobacterium felsineum]MBT1164610.1 hypothetical protein [Bifidobacterium felsineum]